MQSEGFRFLATRIGLLKRRHLPPVQTTGIYSSAQQDQMRALRLLAHAEFEHYLEDRSAELLSDLEQELLSPKAGRCTERIWASNIVISQKLAITNNNGVTSASIVSLFGNFGLTKKTLDDSIPLLLDRMTDFGRQRGDVAHKSAMKATYLLNRIREEKFLNEILELCKKLDSLISAVRLRGFLK